MLKRARVYYEGRVQGVGFRFTATGIARTYKISGYVRNLADGRVELVAEGGEDEIGFFLGEISERMADHIRSEDTSWEEPSCNFQGFSVEY